MKPDLTTPAIHDGTKEAYTGKPLDVIHKGTGQRVAVYHGTIEQSEKDKFNVAMALDLAPWDIYFKEQSDDDA
jgi:hypothetical protein